VDVVRSRYAAYQADATSTLARSVLRRIGTVQDVWRDYVWPTIRQKILATLTAASREVTQRPRSFEFLGERQSNVPKSCSQGLFMYCYGFSGYDVIFDAALEPWILEVNMSPAMAHRTPEQSRLIESMCKGLLKLAVFPYFQASREATPRTNGDSDGTTWEPLTPVSSSVPPTDRPTISGETPREEGNVTPAPVLNDWDEIVPPDGQTRPPKGSALMRKYSGVAGRQASAGVTSATAGDPYFQKFIDAAASEPASFANSGRASSAKEGVARGVAAPNLIAVGTAVTEGTIAVIDSICVGSDKLRALKR
jgi:hypothetical protein